MPLARTGTAGCAPGATSVARHLQRDTSKNADLGPRPPQTHGPRLRMVTAAFDTPQSTPTLKVLLFFTHSLHFPKSAPASSAHLQPGPRPTRCKDQSLTPARGQRCEDREGTQAQKRTSRARARVSPEAVPFDCKIHLPECLSGGAAHAQREAGRAWGVGAHCSGFRHCSPSSRLQTPPPKRTHRGWLEVLSQSLAIASQTYDVSRIFPGLSLQDLTLEFEFEPEAFHIFVVSLSAFLNGPVSIMF